MKRFDCQNCGNEVYFRNSECVVCGHCTGYAPMIATMLSAQDAKGPWIAEEAGDAAYRLCANHQHDVCNWLVLKEDPEPLCAACRHNDIIPDLSNIAFLEGWRALELAKRYMFYSIIRWDLPAPTIEQSATSALIFDFRADEVAPDGKIVPALTGHDAGRITINIAEGDDAERERRRKTMGEPYRTLIGHFRHEVGHYYWDLLVRDGNRVEDFRALFGNEEADYGEALARHYKQGPSEDWSTSFISTYATSHPWEDWAETFAHYIHMVDGLETARAFGIKLRYHKTDVRDDVNISFDPYHAKSVQELIEAWVPFTVAINAVNRSLGQSDLYPFVLSDVIEEKLSFVHRVIHDSRGLKLT